jgi:ankyrin repeat protein
MVRLLVQRGANIHAPGFLESTTLYWAACGGHEEVVAYLLSQGAKDGTPTVLGVTPLMMAASGGHLGVVKMLMKHMEGQGLDQRDEEISELLLSAAWGGHGEIVAFLLSQGAKADIKGLQSWTPLMGAAMGGHVGVVMILVKHMGTQGLDERDAWGKTALYYAAERGREGSLRALLLAGADPTITDNAGRTPLAIAGVEGRQGCVEILNVSI